YAIFAQIDPMKNVLFVLLLFTAVSCQSQPGSADTKNSPDQFEQGIQSANIQVLDVRKAAEFKTGHIKNALQADWTNKDQFFDRIQYMDKDRPVYIYCIAGGRSAAAAEWMRNNGYKTVIELSGGLLAWKNSGKPVEGSSNEKQMTLEEYQASIPAGNTVLVDFGAEWCPPCVKMAPLVNDLQNNKKLNFLLIKIDAGIHTNLMKALNIEPIPVFIIYKKGKEVWRKEGIVSREEFLAQLN
ncbi:MAG: rhodanese-like domain-containing protein, partial [Chitinophagaceae bacterium]